MSQTWPGEHDSGGKGGRKIHHNRHHHPRGRLFFPCDRHLLDRCNLVQEQEGEGGHSRTGFHLRFWHLQLIDDRPQDSKMH